MSHRTQGYTEEDAAPLLAGIAFSHAHILVLLPLQGMISNKDESAAKPNIWGEGSNSKKHSEMRFFMEDPSWMNF